MEGQGSNAASRAPETIAEIMESYSVVIVKGIEKSELKKIVLDFVDRYKELAFEIAQIKVDQRNDSAIWLLFPSEVRLNTVIRLLAHVESLSANDVATKNVVGLSRLPIFGLPIVSIAAAFFVFDSGVEEPFMIVYTVGGYAYRFTVEDEPEPVLWNGKIPCEVLRTLHDVGQFLSQTGCEN